MFRALITLILRSTRLCVRACGIMHPRCCPPIAWKRSSAMVYDIWCIWHMVYDIYHYWSPPPGYRPATSWVHYTTSCNTQSGAPEDGRDQRPKHFELIGIINKPLLLHLVVVDIIYEKIKLLFVLLRKYIRVNLWRRSSDGIKLAQYSTNLQGCQPSVWNLLSWVLQFILCTAYLRYNHRRTHLRLWLEIIRHFEHRVFSLSVQNLSLFSLCYSISLT